jgi:Zn-dependent peptidase ImmA (M78 family)
VKLLETLLYEQFKLHIDDSLNFTEQHKETTKEFLNFCCEELNLTGSFTCKIVFDRKSNGIKTTAYYMDSDKLVMVYGKNRMLGDILRSVAHELVHKKQHEENRIEYPVQDVGGEIEDEANAVAGVIVKKFIKTHKLGENLFEGKLDLIK